MNAPLLTAHDAAPLLQVTGLKKHFVLNAGFTGFRRRTLRAIDDVSFDISSGETLSVVGESGCGKSTLAKSLMQLYPATAGEVRLAGKRIDNLSSASFRPLRRRIQMVFQDPFSSLNPRLRVRDSLAEPIRNFGLARSRDEIDSRVARLLDRVGLQGEAADRFPHEFSGGQRQRICIARALASKPDLIICDEAVSALDVSVKAQIINLLQDLQADLNLALLFISHDLAVVQHMTHRVMVMYLGKIVEIGPRNAIFGSGKHPYTRALLSAVPVPKVGAARDRIVLKGDLPSPISPPSGCRFHTRCPHAFDRCRTEEPGLNAVGAGHLSACHMNV